MKRFPRKANVHGGVPAGAIPRSASALPRMIGQRTGAEIALFPTHTAPIKHRARRGKMPRTVKTARS